MQHFKFACVHPKKTYTFPCKYSFANDITIYVKYNKFVSIRDTPPIICKYIGSKSDVWLFADNFDSDN